MDFELIPYSLEAEVSLLGGCFLDPTVFTRAGAILTHDDFYIDRHKEIFRALCAVGVDLVSVTEYLKKRGVLERVGGMDAITEILSAPITSAGSNKHIEVVKDCAVRREVIRACSDISNLANEGDLSEIAGKLKSLSHSIYGQTSPDIGENVLDEVFRDIEARAKSGDHKIGIATGIGGIDRWISGLEGKTLTYLIGRPSMGKTALALAMAENIAATEPGTVLFFSLEMGDKQIARRRISAHSGVFLSRIRHGDIERGQWDDLIQALNELSSSRMVIIDKPKYKTIENLLAFVESFSLDNKISCMFVDHIQLMRSNQRFNSRHLEISHISNTFKDIAKDKNIPVIVLSQLNREVEKRNNKRPQLHDLKESGDLEQDADLVIGIYRSDRESEEMELGGLKGRDIGTWVSTVNFNRFTQRIE